MSALHRLWSLREERPAFVALAVGVLAFLLAYPLIDWQLRGMGVATPFRFYDFGAYAGAIDRWHAGEPLYVENEDGGYHGSYLYPPVFLLLFFPFVELLPFRQAAMAWNAVSVGLLWVGLQLVVGALGYRLRLWERAGLLWLLLGFQPLLLATKLAQVSAFVSAMLCFAFAGLVRGERGIDAARLASGTLTAVAGTVKLAYAPVGAHLLADRRRLAGAVAGGLALLGVSLLVSGVEAHRTYLDVLTWGKGWADTPRSPTLWLPPYFRPLYVFGELAILVRVAGCLAVATLALLAADTDHETFALGLSAMPLLAPQADAYYFVAVLPAVLVLLATELERDGYPAVPVVGVFLLAVHSYGLKLVGDVLTATLSGDASVLVALLQPGLWGSVLLAGIAAVRVGQTARLPKRVVSRDPPGLSDT